MTVPISCPECDRRLKASPTSVGKKLRCPGCETVFVCRPDDEPIVNDEPEEQSDDSDAGEERPRARRRRRPSIKKRSSAGLWIGLAIAGGLLILLIVGGGAAVVYLALRRPSIPDADWATFTTPDGACSIQMPGTPTFQVLPPTNGISTNKYLLVRQREDVFFMVGYVDVPTLGVTPELLQKAGAGERDNLIQKLGGAAVVDQETTVLGYAGRDLQIRAAPPKRGMILERLFLVPNGLTTRLYIVGTGGSTIESGSAVADKFFDSLSVKAGPTVTIPLPAPPPMLQPPILPKLKPKK
jgi:hypothetical protein